MITCLGLCLGVIYHTRPCRRVGSLGSNGGGLGPRGEEEGWSFLVYVCMICIVLYYVWVWAGWGEVEVWLGLSSGRAVSAWVWAWRVVGWWILRRGRDGWGKFWV